MRKILLVAVVVLLVLIGLPLLMPGMSLARCDDCGPAMGAGVCLVVVMIRLAAGVVLHAGRLKVQGRLMLGLLRSAAFERPPQAA